MPKKTKKKQSKFRQFMAVKWPMIGLVGLVILFITTAAYVGVTLNQAGRNTSTKTSSGKPKTQEVEQTTITQPSSSQPALSEGDDGDDSTLNTKKSYISPPSYRNSGPSSPNLQPQAVSTCNKALATSYASKRNADIGSENYFHNIQVTSITSYYQASGLSGSPQLANALQDENIRHNSALTQIEQIYQAKLVAIECA